MSEGILVDSPIWSLLLRRSSRHTPASAALELERLIAGSRALIIGPIRQEVLSGIPQASQYDKVDRFLQEFSNTPLEDEDYREAARCFNLCRARGGQG